VVADAIGGVTLDRVATKVAEFGPTSEETRRRGHNGGDCGATLVADELQRRSEAL
jgi:hypothetical protein